MLSGRHAKSNKGDKLKRKTVDKKTDRRTDKRKLVLCTTKVKTNKATKNTFDLLTLKKMLAKNMIVPCKYAQPKDYSSTESKNYIRKIKESILKKKWKIPTIISVSIGGIYHITKPDHIKNILAIKSISKKQILERGLDPTVFKVVIITYPYISKQEVLKMC